MFKSQSITFISAVVVAVLISWILVIPQVGRVNSLGENKRRQTEELVVIRGSQTAINDAVAFFTSVSDSDKAVLDLSAPPSPDIHDIAVLMNKLITESGLVLRDINIAESDKKFNNTSVVVPVPVTITAVGTYENFKIFLTNIENILRIFDIAKLDIAEESASAQTPQFIFTVQGSAYYSR